jgi:hypothetical protein
VNAQQTIGIHDALLSPVGLGMMPRFFTTDERPYLTLTPGDSVEVD